jgi:hypothetical protein
MPTVNIVANIEPGTQRFACVSSTFYRFRLTFKHDAD